jgi:hypothetical protein
MAQIEVRRDAAKYNGEAFIARDTAAGMAEIDYPSQKLWEGWRSRIMLPPTWTNPGDILEELKSARHINWTALDRLLKASPGYPSFVGNEGLTIWSWHDGDDPADWPMYVTSQEFLDRHRSIIQAPKA